MIIKPLSIKMLDIYVQNIICNTTDTEKYSIFSDLKEAIKARIKAEKQYFGKFMGSNKKFEYLLNE